MKTCQNSIVATGGLALALIATTLLCPTPVQAGKYAFTVRGNKTFINERRIIVKGLRCSNALVSDESAEELIVNLDTFTSLGELDSDRGRRGGSKYGALVEKA